MANFVTVTRKDTKTPQVVNMDAVEMIDIVPPDALPPLDSPLSITEAHLGSAVLHFSSGRTSMAIVEDAEDLAGLVKSDPEASKAVIEAHQAKIAEIVDKRASERYAAQQAALEASHAAAQKELEAKAPVAASSEV